MNYTIDELKNWLKENLNEERYEHSLGTAECAKKLASDLKLNEEKAYLAGLVHDCAKCFDKNKTNEILKNLELVCGEYDNPKTHHAPVGAYFAKKEFGIQDDEILSAVRWHTIGKPDMTLFEKIIFLADKIEKRTRPKDYAEPIRTIYQNEGMNKALLACYKCTIKSLTDRNLTICTATIDIYNELIKNLSKT